MRVMFIAYDNDDYIANFPSHYAALIAYIEQNMDSVQCIVYNQDLYHTTDEDIKTFIERVEPDYVCIGSVAGYYPYRKLISISEQVNKAKNRNSFTYIMGGFIVSPEPEYFLRKMGCDIIIRGEGEKPLLNILKGNKLIDIKGISYIENKLFINNESEELLQLKGQPLPAYQYFNVNLYRLIRYPNTKKNQFALPIFTGRGCPFHCTFCYRLYEGLRLYPIERIKEDIELLHKNYDITYFMFFDELTMCSTKRINDICDMLDSLSFKINWACNGRLNIVTEEMLKRMKSTGCVFINYGIESLDNKVLENMKKKLTEEQIIKGIEATLKYNISPGFNIIWGNKGDTVEALKKGVKFLLKYDDGSQRRTIRPVTPYPGCELYYDAIKTGKLDGVRDFYENKHKNSEFLTINYTDIPDNEFHSMLCHANTMLLNNYYSKQKASIIKQVEDLYKYKDYTFRGFR